jgi:hypothetical protein
MSASNYRRVSSAESQSAEATASNSLSSSSHGGSRRSLSERVGDKLWAVGWVTVAILTAYATNFWSVVLLLQEEEAAAAAAAAADDETSKTTTTPATLLLPNKSLLQIVALLFGIQTILVLYLTVYLPKIKGLTDSSAWEVYCPRVIPCMTVTGITSGLLLMRAVWPVWGFLAPLILGVEAMGCLFALHFVPWPF